MIPLATVPPATHLVHGPDSPIVALARACARIGRSDATVLVSGETGVGKEVFARLVHESSARVGGSLVAVNCGAIPEALLESELFGHTRGAFTGATAARRGRIAAASGGTLFLDEIGELPLSLQVKLLRVLQERCYEPVGATESVPADFRLVAATNRDLAAEVEAGRFRRDLYYRLLVCPIEVPPLRTRRGDIPYLFAHFWRTRGEARPVDATVLRLLEEHSWPGNVRELENLVERLSVCAEGATIRVSDLPPHLRPDSVEVAPLALVHLDREPDVEAEREEVRAMVAPAGATSRDRVVVDEAHPVDLPALLRGLEDAYAAVKVLSQDAGIERFRVVVNPVATDAHGRIVFGRLAGVTDRFLRVQLSFLGHLPHDDNLQRALMAQRAVVELYPRTPVARGLENLTRQLLAAPPPPTLGGGLHFLWNRLQRDRCA